MNEPAKLLSIIVPSYNMEEYLPKCLGSLIVPDDTLLQRLDVLVVNDGSTDRTSEIAHDFERRYPGVFRVIDKRNGNYGSCINAALPEATGRYVKILDADDSFDNGVFARFIVFVSSQLTKAPPDVIISDFVVVDTYGNMVRQHIYGPEGDTFFTLSSIDYRKGRSMWMHALTYRTDLVRDIGYRQIEGISYTDQEWVAIPMMSARSFCRFPESLYRYLVGRPGQTVNPSIKYRNFSMNLIVYKEIIKEYLNYREHTKEENTLYVREFLDGPLRRLYTEYLISHPRFLDQKDIKEFDVFLKTAYPKLHAAMNDHSVIFTKRKIPFFFVREWRWKESRRTFKFALCDFVLLCRRIHKSLRTGPT